MDGRTVDVPILSSINDPSTTRQVLREGSDSMRIDISKDNVLAANRRVKAKDYPMLGFLDPRPVSKFYWELRAKALERKKGQ